jgi:Ca-activated chloride channel family protein
MRNLFFWMIVIGFTMTTLAQERTISGIVSDEMGPVADISVKVMGTSRGTVTDFDGNYSIKASIGDILEFSHVSYAIITKEVKKSSVINVTMKESGNSLSEVVVTASGLRRIKKLFRKSKQRKVNITNSLSGKVAGVQITTNSGSAGNSSRIVLRGATSVTNNTPPLYVINGKPITVGMKFGIASIKPENIKSVSVLKGVSAVPLYGSKASNGVIIITTKNGVYKALNKKQDNKLYVVDGKVVPFKEYTKIAPNKIKSVEMLKNRSLLALYGKKAKHGVVSITTFNEEEMVNENYQEIIENQFNHVYFAPLSTFSIDVDKASYSNVRRMINNGQNIPADAVKTEEMINYFDYNYSQPIGEHPFSIQTEIANSPITKNAKIIKIGLQGKNIASKNIPASNLVFLIDVSGSMGSPNKLPLLKAAFKILVKQLRNKDKISIVVYAGAAGVVLESASGDDKNKILQALENLNAGGSTAGGQGIELAYKIAQKNYIKNGNNRIILATDGDFNVGASSDKSMEDLIVEKRKSGVFLTVLGFGMGNYKDSKLEILADKGNGNHAYIDTMQEAKRVLGTEFGGTLYTIAKDVKIQVEFNPNKVQAYRLIGYENRLLADEDFIDDTKDAGELGSNHTVTAMYEVIPVGVESKYLKNIEDLKYTRIDSNNNFNDELLTVKFRYKKPSENKSKEIVHVVKNENTQFDKASQDFKFATSVAMFSMKLRKSKYTRNLSYKDIITIANQSRGIDKHAYRAEFVRLVETVSTLN